MVRGRLTDIINTAPNKLSQTVWIMNIINNNFTKIFGTPARIAVAER